MVFIPSIDCVVDLIRPSFCVLHTCMIAISYNYSNFCACLLVDRAGRNSPAAPLLAGPVFLKVKMKYKFYKKEVINKSASVIFGLVTLIILSYKR